MIKNRIPLRNLLAFVLIAVCFFIGCFVFVISPEFGRRTETDIIFYILIGLLFFLIISIVGLLNKGDGGRVVFKFTLIILTIGWTGFAGYWSFTSWKHFDLVEKILLGVMTVIFYSFLVAGISFTNNDKLKEELG